MWIKDISRFENFRWLYVFINPLWDKKVFCHEETWRQLFRVDYLDAMFAYNNTLNSHHEIWVFNCSISSNLLLLSQIYISTTRQYWCHMYFSFLHINRVCLIMYMTSPNPNNTRRKKKLVESGEFTRKKLYE